MNPRKYEDHPRVIEQIRNLSDAIQNPSPEKYSTLMDAAAFIERELDYPAYNKATLFPDLPEEMLAKMEKITQFDLPKFFNNMDKVKDPREMAKELSLTNDPFSLISKITRSKMVKKEDLPEEAQKHWKAIYASDLKHKMELTRKYLKMSMKDASISIAMKTARYSGIAVIIIGTLLMNYIICLIGLGLLLADVTIDVTFNKEDIDPTDEVASDVKDYPYILSGSYPLIQMNRTEEYKQMNAANAELFFANNLLELVKAIVRFENYTMDMNSEIFYWKDEFPFEVLRFYQKGDSFFGLNDEFIYEYKQKLLEASKECMNHDFKIPNTRRASWCNTFRDAIKYFCIWMKDAQQNQFNDIGTLVSMYETLCLQIWDAFLRDNEIIKTQKIVNEYLHVDVTNDLDSIRMLYDMAPANTIQNRAVSMTEATVNLAANKNKKDVPKAIASLVTSFSNAMNTAKETAAKITQRALPWYQRNLQKVKDAAKKFTMDDSATMKNYVYDPKNVNSGFALANEMNTLLETYPKDQSGNWTEKVNTVIKKVYPTIQTPANGGPIPVEEVAQMIATGNAKQPIQDVTIKGQQLKDQYAKIADLLADRTVQQNYASGIFGKLQDTVKKFQTSLNMAAKNPNPQNASVENDSIADMFLEADDPNTPPTIDNQQQQTQSTPNNNQNGQQQDNQQNPNQNQQKNPQTVQPNTNNENHLQFLKYVTSLTTRLAQVLGNIVGEGTGVDGPFYTSTLSRGAGQTPPNTQQQPDQQSAQANQPQPQNASVEDDTFNDSFDEESIADMFESMEEQDQFDLLIEGVDEKRIRQNIEIFKKKYNYTPTNNGPEGWITVDGDRYLVNIDKKNSATGAAISGKSAMIRLDRVFFQVLPRKADAILQHEIGHIKAQAAERTTISKNAQKQFRDASKKYLDQGNGHSKDIEIEADAYAAEKTGERNMKNSLPTFIKKSNKASRKYVKNHPEFGIDTDYVDAAIKMTNTETKKRQTALSDPDMRKKRKIYSDGTFDHLRNEDGSLKISEDTMIAAVSGTETEYHADANFDKAKKCMTDMGDFHTDCSNVLKKLDQFKSSEYFNTIKDVIRKIHDIDKVCKQCLTDVGELKHVAKEKRTEYLSRAARKNAREFHNHVYTCNKHITDFNKSLEKMYSLTDDSFYDDIMGILVPFAKKSIYISKKLLSY